MGCCWNKSEEGVDEHPRLIEDVQWNAKPRVDVTVLDGHTAVDVVAHKRIDAPRHTAKTIVDWYLKPETRRALSKGILTAVEVLERDDRTWVESHTYQFPWPLGTTRSTRRWTRVDDHRAYSVSLDEQSDDRLACHSLEVYASEDGRFDCTMAFCHWGGYDMPAFLARRLAASLRLFDGFAPN